jgi:hypothetical protein
VEVLDGDAFLAYRCVNFMMALAVRSPRGGVRVGSSLVIAPVVTALSDAAVSDFYCPEIIFWDGGGPPPSS